MQTIEELTEAINGGRALSSEEARDAASFLSRAEIAQSSKEHFLIALSDRGETAVEVAAFASAFRDLAIDPGVDQWAARAIDVCGTGGDGAHTFNISTAVSFIVAAAGVPVFKHGNRSITSKCGSADLMEALGIHLEAPHARLRESLDKFNFCFFFAPAFHPAFREIMPVRKALAASGRRTIFNLLGPLINPGRPAHQLMGVFERKWVDPLADALDVMGLKSGLVAHCTPGEGLNLDELSCVGANYVAGFGAFKSRRGVLSPEEGGLRPCELASLEGGDVSANVETLHALFDGDLEVVTKGLIDSILLNAGAAFWITGQSSNLRDGVELARETLKSGAAKAWLAEIKSFYANV